MTSLRRLFRHDWPIIILVLFNLAGIGLYLGVGPAVLGGTGYRVIDIKAVNRLLDAGELSSHEAEWYHRNEIAEKNELK